VRAAPVPAPRRRERPGADRSPSAALRIDVMRWYRSKRDRDRRAPGSPRRAHPPPRAAHRRDGRRGRRDRRAATQLDSLVDIVGRLSRVVDVQGATLHGDETQLERKVGSIEDRVRGLADTLTQVVERLEGMSGALATALGERRSASTDPTR
jgi:hypothetical protein